MHLETSPLSKKPTKIKVSSGYLSVPLQKVNKVTFHPVNSRKSTLKNGAQPSAYLIDASGLVGKAYGAKVTPHIFIIDKSGLLAYQGGIDSKKSTKASDISSAEPYVKNALNQLLAGKAVSTAKTKPYGCSIKYAK